MGSEQDFIEHSVSICEYDACTIRHALCQQLKSVNAEIETLRISRKRNLTQAERWQLPANLSLLPQDELEEQIDPWITLKMTLEDLISRFDLRERT